jgi:hypothetical protein
VIKLFTNLNYSAQIIDPLWFHQNGRLATTCADLHRFAPTKNFFFLPQTKVVACFRYTSELLSTKIIEKLF